MDLFCICPSIPRKVNCLQKAEDPSFSGRHRVVSVRLAAMVTKRQWYVSPVHRLARGGAATRFNEDEGVFSAFAHECRDRKHHTHI